MYDVNDKGFSKTEVFKNKFNIYDKSSVKSINKYINTDNIHEILYDREFIFDCTDNFKSKFLINDYCVNKDKILIHSGVNKERGQVFIIGGNKGISLRTLLNEIPEEVENTNIVTCATIIAGIQVNEFLNFIINRKTSGIIFVTMFPELNIKIIKP
jgi:molybdopterin/thiamine biosynthesis adenylyltransferase